MFLPYVDMSPVNPIRQICWCGYAPILESNYLVWIFHIGLCNMVVIPNFIFLFYFFKKKIFHILSLKWQSLSASFFTFLPHPPNLRNWRSSEMLVPRHFSSQSFISLSLISRFYFMRDELFWLRETLNFCGLGLTQSGQWLSH